MTEPERKCWSMTGRIPGARQPTMCGPAPSGVTNGTERNEDGLHVKVPDAVDPREAALFGMASVAMRSCRNADLRMGDRLLIVGAGFVGQAAAQSPP